MSRRRSATSSSPSMNKRCGRRATPTKTSEWPPWPRAIDRQPSRKRAFLFLFFGLRHLRLDQDPADAEALGIQHLDGQIAQLRAIAGSDLTTQTRSDITTDGLLGRLADVHFQAIGEILDEVVAAHAVSSVAQRLDLRPFAVELVLNLPEQLLGDVLQRNDACRAAG